MPGQNIEKQSSQALKVFSMAPSIPSNNSSQQLVASAEENSEESAPNSGTRTVSAKEWVIVVILCFVNLINYMDRFTLAGKWHYVNYTLYCFICNVSLILYKTMS